MQYLVDPRDNRPFNKKASSQTDPGPLLDPLQWAQMWLDNFTTARLKAPPRN